MIIEKMPAIKPDSKQLTREKIILAGEHLIAVNGVNGVSLRQVNTEAGQKNKSAAHYHFGTREGLILAIYDYRMRKINSQRLALLAAGCHNIEDWIRAWVIPQIEELETEGGSYYGRFMSQVSSMPNEDLRQVWSSRHAEGMQQIISGLRNALPDLPEVVFSIRVGLAMTQYIHVLADRERLLEVSSGNGASSALFISNLIDVMASGLAAPLSSTTQQEILLDINNKLA